MEAQQPIECRFVNSNENDIAWACSPTTKYRVVKSHKFNKHVATYASKLFMTYRDFRDVVASCIRKNVLNKGRFPVTKDGGGTVNFSDPSEVKAFLATEAQNYKGWAYHADMLIPYKRVLSDRVNIVAEIADHLKISVDPASVIHKVGQLEIPTEGPDWKTQFRPNHITDGRIGNYSIVSSEILEMIEEEFDEFIED